MIQWFPGHMHKARKEFAKILPRVDLVIEVLDARLPGSSENPLLARLRRDKPCVKVLNKSDLADAEGLAEWRAHLDAQGGVRTLVTSMRDARILELPARCRELIPARANRSPVMHALIAGIPNVGKSTLINRLAGRKVAKTGGEAALTRLQQRIEISPGLILIDTPGMLWPNIDVEASGYRLAATGAIRDTALDLQAVACFVADFLARVYPGRLRQRYGIDGLPEEAVEILAAIGRRRGCIAAGGRVDLEKVARLLLHELRAGEFGGLCFETPAGLAAEREQAALERQQRDEARAARRAHRAKS